MKVHKNTPLPRPVFKGTEYENTVEILFDSYELMLKMDIIEIYGVEFVFF